MESGKKIQHLIVDTSAFIKNVALQDVGENIITEESVIAEIKNKRQLKRLIVLPYNLTVLQADSDDIKFVSEFSKKTGDYLSLSSTDIKVMALTYRLEKEKVGTENLKSQPTFVKTVENIYQAPLDHPKVLAGFYYPNSDSEEEENDKEETEEKSTEEKTNELDQLLVKMNKNCESGKDQISEDEEVEENSNSEQDLTEKFAQLDCNPKDLILESQNEHDIDDILAPMKDDSAIDQDFSEEEEKEGGEESDDDNGWITPKNIGRVKQNMEGTVNEDKPATVACMTTDFAMQNVLKQIGLHVAALDGKVIKEVRTYILRCYACFKTTSVMTKVFCPKCGHKTLKRVSVSLNDDGTMKIYINFKKTLSAKGKRYSLPTFKGGKHANNPIIRQDQPVPQQRLSALARQKNDPMNDDYIAGYSPFVTRDVFSKSAMLGIRSGKDFKHWMKSNPNASSSRRK